MTSLRAVSRVESEVGGRGCPLHRILEIPRDGGGRVTAGGIGAFAYGLVAYGMFQASFLYAAFFLENWLVPRTVDAGGPVESAGVAALIDVGLLAVFALQHTVMARTWFKRWVTRVAPASIERSTFVALASAALGLVCWQWRPIPTVVWHVEQPVLRAAIVGLSVVGLCVVLGSSFMVNHFDLFGVRQTVLRLMGREYEPIGFRLRGLYRHVRHPLMVGFLIAFWSAPTMTVGHLVFSVVTTVYIFFGVWVEERDLIAAHGESYLAYRRKVGGFVPKLGRGSGDA